MFFKKLEKEEQKTQTIQKELNNKDKSKIKNRKALKKNQ